MINLDVTVLDTALSYPEYRKKLDDLLEEGKTTGPNQDEWLVDYTRLNIHRMNRWDKTWNIPENIEKQLLEIEQPIIWLTITEAWCGDAAQVVPIIEKMASINPMLTHKLILRDENPAIMDQFLTNGTRSIPKILWLDGEDLRILGSWGPRPIAADLLLQELKKNTEIPLEERYNQLHSWYAKNKGKQTAEEFLNVLKEIKFA